MKEKNIQLYEYYLKPGYIFLNSEPSIISTAIGSCVVVSLWDCNRKYGGAANYSHPFIDNKREATARYGNVAVSYLIRTFLKDGTDKKNIKAQIFGGASLLQPTECSEIAKENVRIARSVLGRFKISIISEDVGGDLGRKILYNTFNNEALVYKAKKLRRSDWYPYISVRE
ncbi:MAG: chemotaxis protein CheD [Desulfobacterales bacterium]|nr:chemotaxis protein CheD [Desulfobacterales bacterium]